VATFQNIDIFVSDLAAKLHDFDRTGDQLSIALSANATPPVATNDVLADLTEIAYTFLDNPGSEGSTLARQPVISSTTDSSALAAQAVAGTHKYILEGRTGAASDLVLSAVGGSVATFRWITHYNLDATTPKLNPLIQFYDHGSDVNLAAGETFTIDYNSALGFFTLTAT